MVERSILLIDDEELVLKSVSHILVQAGYKVDLAGSAESGLDLFEKNKYPLVITDLIMGGLGGIGVLKRVKEVRPETMVIVITGCGKLDSTVGGMESGADGYLLKPCTRDELVQKVADCFEKLERK